jgi:NADPH:quinone reductase-like Zn-dependent oxidoreductase
MRAAQHTAFGGPDVLSIVQIERPTIGPKEVLVEVRSAAVTHGDRRLRAADFPGISAVLGRLLFGVFAPRYPVGGTSFAGRVVEVGPEVTRYAVGDDVFGSVMHGAYGELLAVSEGEAMAKMPSNTTYPEAAALPYGGATALHFLRGMAKVQPGERVLIVGASGGVGRLAVQVAKHLGAHVTGVLSADHDRVRELGADAVIDYRSEDFTRREERWDVIFDTTEGDHFRSFRRVLTPTGRYLSLYLTLRILFEMALTALRGGQRAMAGAAMGDPALFDDLKALVEAGAIREPIAKRYPLEAITEAHAELERERSFGSLVVDVGAASPALRRVA